MVLVGEVPRDEAWRARRTRMFVALAAGGVCGGWSKSWRDYFGNEMIIFVLWCKWMALDRKTLLRVCD